MLREITTLKAYNKSRRRWYSDDDMDLFIWFDYQMPVQFQLIYDKRRDERALLWDTDQGYIYSMISADISDRHDVRMDLTVLDEHDFDATRIAREFLIESEALEPTLADFIYARLLECPQSHRPVSGHRTVSATA